MCFSQDGAAVGRCASPRAPVRRSAGALLRRPPISLRARAAHQHCPLALAQPARLAERRDALPRRPVLSPLSLEYWIPAFAGMTTCCEALHSSYFASPSDLSAAPLSSLSAFMNSA